MPATTAASLKAPAHGAELDHLVAAFPGAVVVHLHRDIVETIAFAVLRSTYGDAVAPIDVGRFPSEQTALWLRRAVDDRSSAASSCATFVDLGYRDLVADPAAAARPHLRAAAMQAPADLEQLVADYDVRQPARRTRRTSLHARRLRPRREPAARTVRVPRCDQPRRGRLSGDGLRCAR